MAIMVTMATNFTQQVLVSHALSAVVGGTTDSSSLYCTFAEGW
jgi:hypothetical protein